MLSRHGNGQPTELARVRDPLLRAQTVRHLMRDKATVETTRLSLRVHSPGIPKGSGH